MKKLLLTLIILSISSSIFAQTQQIGTYPMGWLRKPGYISVSDIRKQNFTVNIQVEAMYDFTNAWISVRSRDLDRFVRFLTQVRDKYAEWSETAKTNNVTNTSVLMDFWSPRIRTSWQVGTSSFFNDYKIRAKFMVLRDGSPIIDFSFTATHITNRFIKEEIKWAFLLPSQLDELISQLDPGAIRKKVQKAGDNRELFR